MVSVLCTAFSSSFFPQKLPQLRKDLPPPALDVVVVGAGAAGVGTALMLTTTFGLDSSRVLLVERGEEIGETFRRWPDEMRFISPSFNQQGWTSSFDLNSVAYGTSPAYSLHAEHPSGVQYADYLNALVSDAKLCVRTQTEVVSVQAEGVEGGPPRFSVGVSPASSPSEPGSRRTGPADATETLTTRYVVWAAGEFQYPAETESSGAVEGAELCLHNSRVRSWADLPGDDFAVIGGYESGADAAFNLAKAGKRCTVLASSASWDVCTPDPSAELAPYTAGRLREVTAAGFSPRPKLLSPLRVRRVEKAATGGFNVIANWKAAERLPPPGRLQLRRPLEAKADAGGTADTSTEDLTPAQRLAAAYMEGTIEGDEHVVHTPQPPILCTGFEGSVAAAASHLFDLAEESEEGKGCLCGAPRLTADDESTKVPGVFLVGPAVSQGGLSFCFIYKFRQRFAVVANAICRGLGRDTTAAVALCRKTDMYLGDAGIACCADNTCGDSSC